MGFLKSVGKVLAAPYTAGASLGSSNKISDWISGTVANTAPAVSGAVGGDSGALLSNILGGVYDVLKDKYNLANQKELAHYEADEQMRLNQDAFNKNLQMWNMENAYNSPEQQMARFEAAGLNKNLIYGQQNTAGSGPTFQAPTFNVGDYHPVDTRMQRQQLALAMEEHKAQLQNQQIENMMKAQHLDLAERTANREDRLVDAQIKAMQANLGLHHLEFGQRLSETKEQNAWRRYQDDKKLYEKRIHELSKLPYGMGKHAVSEFKSKNRAPMYMDYL